MSHLVICSTYQLEKTLYDSLLPFHAGVVVGFNPISYTFMESMGVVSLVLEISNLPGILESDIEITVNLVDGTNAGERLLVLLTIAH